MLKIRTAFGSELFLTAEHRLCTLLGYIAAGELRVGSRIAAGRRGGEFFDEAVPEQQIYDAAHALGSKSACVPAWVFRLSKSDTRLFATQACPVLAEGSTGLVESRRLAMDVRRLWLKLGVFLNVRQLADDRYALTCHDPQCDAAPQECVELLARLISGESEPTNQPLRICDVSRTLDVIARLCPERRDEPEYHMLNAAINKDIVWDKIVSIEDGGVHQTYDITVEGDSNYLADNIVSHNSLNLSRSELLDLITIPNYQMLYVSPLQSQTQRYSKLYINEAINSCPLAKAMQQQELANSLSDSNIITALHHQSFANGSGIQLSYAKMSPDRARGIMADAIDFDEVQDQLVDNIPIISESLTSSKWGVRRFTGTAKTTDNTIEGLWQKSSQCEWVMRCGCGYWNIPNEDGGVLKMIQADGLHCVKCGAKLNVRQGEWVATWPERMRTFRGYHISQVIVPAIVENPVKWSGVLRKVLTYPLPLLMQEVLGISCSVGARIITQQDIDRQSTLPNVAQLQKQLNHYIMTVSGIDWGGAEQSSFTVHTIIGIRPEGGLDVIWARRFMGFDPDEVLSEIAKAHRYYGCVMAAADYGMGFDKNIMLQQRFGVAVAQIMFLGKQHKLMSYSPTQGHARWTVDKTSALELLFLAIKYGRIRFPPQSEFKIYTDDLLSPYEDISETGGLASRKFLRNPHRPDDFCMALCFGSILAMKLVNSSMVDLVPKGAFGGGVAGLDGGAPAIVNVNPDDVVAALQAG